MIDFISQYFAYFGSIWLFCIVTGMFVRAINEKIIYTRDLIFALMFGPIWWLFQVGSLDTVLWKQKEKLTK